MTKCAKCNESLIDTQTVLYESSNMALCKCGTSNCISYAALQCLKMDIDLLYSKKTLKRYECGQCEYATESFRAIDNVPSKTHLCRYCYNLVSSEIQSHYKEIVDEPIPDTLRIANGFATIKPFTILPIDWTFDQS